MSDAQTTQHETQAESRPPRINRVWWLNAVIVVTAAVVIHHLPLWHQPYASPHIPWYLLLFGFAAAERCVVHLHFKRGAHSFSLGEVPLVFALIFSRPGELLIAIFVSSFAVMAFERRLPPIKTVFNVGQFLLSAAVAMTVFHAVAPEADAHVGPLVWLAAFLATKAGGALTVALIASAIGLTEGGVTPAVIKRMLALDGLVAIANTSVALAGAVVLTADPPALLLLAAPVGIVFAAYRAYQAERQRMESLELLYQTTRELSRTPEVGAAIEGLLARSMDAFRAAAAEIVLFGRDDAPPLRTALGLDRERTLMAAADPALVEDLRVAVEGDAPVVLVRPADVGPTLGAHFTEHGVRSAMIAALRDDHGITGVLLVADGQGVAREFGPDDRKVFEALANNASVALQYDQLEQAVGQLRDLQEDLEHQAYHDPLTDLPNRSYFNERLTEALARPDSGVAVLFVDLDDFKTVNDTRGHDAGDALLVAVARRLQSCVRPIDTVARFGGDEFALLVYDGGNQADGGEAVAQRILSAFRSPITILGRPLDVHTSVGVVLAAPGAHPADVLRDADVAMYSAKQSGKNRYRIFEPSMLDAAAERRGLHEQLERAIAAEEFTLRYQPIVSLSDGHPVGAEALVRWNHPDRGVVEPAGFIPLAEESGLIVAVGRLVLAQACEQVRRWQDADPDGERLTVHVNVSPAELERPEYTDFVAAELERNGLAPSQLVVEVTETVVMNESRATRGGLARLRELGVKLALDDFGSAATSLHALRAVPLDILKLGKRLVGVADGHAEDVALLRALIDVATNLEMSVVASTVETASQTIALRRLGCAVGQGHHLGRPFAEVDERPLTLAP